MAKSFAITTVATEPVRADSKGRAQVVFTVTNTSARPVRGLAKPKPLGDTKRESLRLEGEAERDFAVGATHQFTVIFEGPSTEPAAKAAAGAPESAAAPPAPTPPKRFSFRLDVESAQNPDEDFSEGPVVTVEIMPPPTPKGKPKWWILIVIAAVVLIGLIVLIIVLLSGRKTTNDGGSPTPTPVATPSPVPTETAMPTATAVPSPTEPVETRCFNLVQGQIAWDYKGSKTWSPTNVQNLCRGTSNPDEPPRCFQRVMHGGINWGGSTQWQWQNASNLCAGTNNADQTISCFQAKIAAGIQWPAAIAACKK